MALRHQGLMPARPSTHWPSAPPVKLGVTNNRRDSVSAACGPAALIRCPQRVVRYARPVTAGAATATAPLLEKVKEENAHWFEALRNLMDLGIEQHMEVPKIVICGDQSSGKSSIIQRIIGVDLPRSDGTCTRCPMELQLVQAPEEEDWTMRVKLRYEDTNSNSEPRVVQFGDVITGKTEVQGVVERAQAAVLNPEMPPEHFIAGALPDRNALKFTKSVVVLEIRHHTMVNLILVDLPGIIRNASDPADQKYVAMVMDLTREQISKDETVIVAIFSCKTEMEGQEVFDMARKADKDGKRTIGVLTKADTIEPNTHSKWFGYIKGEAYGLKLGYYMVRNPPQLELDMTDALTSEGSHEKERQFFANTLPFSEAGLDNSMGLDKLVPVLSELLTSRVRRCLPENRKKAQQELAEIDAEIASLPEIISETEAPEKLRQLIDGLEQEVMGLRDLGRDPKDPAVAKLGVQLKGYYNEFNSRVFNTRPRFELAPAREGSSPRDAVFAEYGVDELDEDLDDDDDVVVLTMQDVTGIIEERSGLELPGSISYGAFLETISRFQTSWRADAEACLDSAHESTSEVVLDMVEEQLKGFPRLNDTIASFTTSICNAAKRSAVEELKRGLLSEQGMAPPFTSHQKDFAAMAAEISGGIKYQLALLGSPTLEAYDSDEEDELWEDFKKTVEAEPFAHLLNKPYRDMLGRISELTLDQQHAVTIMATTMAYHQVASKRVGETVPMIFRDHLLNSLATGYKTSMLRELASLDAELTATNGDRPPSGVRAPLPPAGAIYSSPAVMDLLLGDEELRKARERRKERCEHRAKLQKAVAVLRKV